MEQRPSNYVENLELHYPRGLQGETKIKMSMGP